MTPNDHNDPNDLNFPNKKSPSPRAYPEGQPWDYNNTNYGMPEQLLKAEASEPQYVALRKIANLIKQTLKIGEKTRLGEKKRA